MDTKVESPDAVGPAGSPPQASPSPTKAKKTDDELVSPSKRQEVNSPARLSAQNEDENRDSVSPMGRQDSPDLNRASPMETTSLSQLQMFNKRPMDTMELTFDQKQMKEKLLDYVSDIIVR